ncbi:hypothetical protein [Mycobacterium sp. OTB74]|uniref:hypothetical protein n=1 Tax=Mycobacterium sp. OTB74 TaxID=1853452 RepID=UPI0024770A02|nr:hypothetical protein [Mycobacterium sp. OTB74]
MDAAYLAAGVPRPDWLQELFDRDGDIGANRQDPGGEPVGRDPAAEPVALTAETDTADPEPVEEDSIDPQDALIMLRDMVAAISQEGRTVEPLVVLLWALGRARAFQPQLTRYGDVVGELSELLLAWAPESDPVQVWLDLAAAWPQWWQIVMPTSAEASEAPNLQGGLSNSIYELAALDTSWNLQAEQVLRDAIGPGPELSDLLVTVGLAAPPQAAAPVGAQPYKVPVEQNIVEEYTVEYDAMASTTRLRREAMLQNRYVEHLRAQGHAVCGYRIPIDGQYFRADLYDGTTDELIEVKSSVDRVTMRLALGQILDYARVLRPTLCTVLVPERPADGLIDLFGDHEVRLVWPTEAGEFVS